jgi:hypothetical protein
MVNTPDRWRVCYRALAAALAVIILFDGSGASAFVTSTPAPSDVRSEKVDADDSELIPASLPGERKTSRPRAHWPTSNEPHSRVEQLYAALTRLAPPRRDPDHITGGIRLRC